MERSELDSYLQDRPYRLAGHLHGDAVREREAIERVVAALERERWPLVHFRGVKVPLDQSGAGVRKFARCRLCAL